MITNMEELNRTLAKLKVLLIESNESKLAKDLENALYISQSSLEVLGQIGIVISEIKRKEIIKKGKINEEVDQIDKFIKRYW